MLEILLPLIGLTFNVLRWLARPYFWLKARRPSRRVPPIASEILLLSATELSRKIRRKEVSAVEVLSCYVERIKEVDPLINAVVENRFRDAAGEARCVDDFLKSTEMSEDDISREKPLLGVPLTFKECCGVEGMKATLGSLNRIDARALTDGDPVWKLKRAGGIPLLVSNTSEYCLCWETENLVTGRTNNPYDTNRTAGGSSGGEGALLGAAASILGVGCDVGGSVRIPAAMNGVFGHKPSRGVVSIENHLPLLKVQGLRDLLNVGPLCRHPEDLTLMLRVMSKNPELLGLDDDVDLKELNVFYMEELSNSLAVIRVQDEIKDVVRKAVKHLEENCKATVRGEKFPEMAEGSLISYTGLVHYDHSNPEVDSGFKDPKGFNLFKEIIRCLRGKSLHSFKLLNMYMLVKIYNFFLCKNLEKYKRFTENFKKKLVDLLDVNGVFIYPTFPFSATYHDEYVFNSSCIMYTMPINILGLPSTSIPMGLDSKGLPIAIQVVAGPDQDKLCIAVAKELGKAFGGWIPPS